MPRVALIVTGDLEHRGLAQSLERAFPGVEFAVEPKWGSFTSARVAPLRASFHLMVPMTEAYFFAHTAPLAAAGVRSPPVLDPGRDIEDFTVLDPAFLAWAPGKAKHPKRYLQYLIDPTEVRRYRESEQGVAALTAVSWRQIAAANPEHQLRCLRSLLLDLAEGLGSSAAPISGEPHAATWRPGSRERVLRNL